MKLIRYFLSDYKDTDNSGKLTIVKLLYNSK